MVSFFLIENRFRYAFGLLIWILLGCEEHDRLSAQGSSIHIEEVITELSHPWALAFLPDGSILITEREGTLRLLSPEEELSPPLKGLPEVYAQGQGGMLDLALHPDYEKNGWIYISFSEPGPDETACTALGRGKLVDGSIDDFEVIFRQEPKVEGPNHFGGRILFRDGFVYLFMGERFKFDPAQNLSNHLGTIVRLNPDGSIPPDNPFVGRENARDEIWSYGHRNIEAVSVDPRTGHLWIAEMGPEGGDELNLIEKGKNYGWPIVSWGRHYGGDKIPDPPTRPEFTDAVIHWTPVISPSGMDFYTGDLFPNYKNHMLIGGLTAKGIVVVEVEGRKAKEVDRIDLGARTREVKQGPDGAIYVLTDQDDGKLLRLTPKNKP